MIETINAMINYKEVPKSGDPSSRLQSFEVLQLRVHCCRYWWLDKWKSHRMSFPYWRLYWNKTRGAYVIHDKKVELSPDCLVLIPPNTSFSTGIEADGVENETEVYELAGSWLKNAEEEQECEFAGKTLHMFIHFNMGSFLDTAYKGVYCFEMQPDQRELIDKIRAAMLSGSTYFGSADSFLVYQLILSAFNQLPDRKVASYKMDARVRVALSYIEKNISAVISNDDLARQLNMATNSFTRFFREHLKMSPQEYVRQERIALASEFLDHTNYTIDEIADRCGFSDRFHFSKTFKKVKGVPPAEYKKRFILT